MERTWRTGLVLLLGCAFLLHAWWIGPLLLVQNYNDDLFWYMPVLLIFTHAGGFPAALDFVFSRAGEWGVPSVNAYHLILLRVFGNDAGMLSCAGLAVLYLNTILFILCLWRVLRLRADEAVLAGLLFLVFYADFHSYTWSMAVQHQFVLLGVFGLLLVYDSTDRARQRGAMRAYQYVLVLVPFLLCSLLRTPVLLVLPMMCLLFLFRSHDLARLMATLRFWLLPMGCLFASFPLDLYHHTWGWQVERGIQNVFPAALLNTTVALPAYYALGLLLLVAGLAGLAALSWALRLRPRANLKLPYWLKDIACALPLLWLVALIVRDRGETPARLSAMLGAYLVPWDHVMNRLTAARWQLLPVNRVPTLLDVALLLGFLLLALYALSRNRDVTVLLLLTCAILVYLHVFLNNYPGLKKTGGFPSRYSLYLAPLLATVLAMGIAALARARVPFAGRWAPTMEAWLGLKTGALLACLLLFSVASVHAIRERLTVTAISDTLNGWYTLLNMKLGADLRDYLQAHPDLNDIYLLYSPQAYAYDLWFFPNAFVNNRDFHPVLVGLQSELAPRRIGGRQVQVRFTDDPALATLHPCPYYWCDAAGLPLDRLNRTLLAAANAVSEGQAAGQAALAERLMQEEPYLLRAARGYLGVQQLFRRYNSQDWVGFWDRAAWRGINPRAAPGPQDTPSMGITIRLMLRNDLIARMRALLVACYLKQRLGQPCGKEPVLAFRQASSQLEIGPEDLSGMIASERGREQMLAYYHDVFAPQVASVGQ